MSYFRHPVKCLKCSLHFNVYSDHRDWPNYGNIKVQEVVCPECAAPGSCLRFPAEKVEGFIFQAVPGKDWDKNYGNQSTTMDPSQG